MEATKGEGEKMSSIEATFITLNDALGNGRINRIYAKRRHAKRGRPIHKEVSVAFVAKLLQSCGEMYAGRWAASADACRELDYETILVDFAEGE